jgi:hypothetical protein
MLAEILGHRDTRMIDIIYGHLFEKEPPGTPDSHEQTGSTRTSRQCPAPASKDRDQRLMRCYLEAGSEHPEVDGVIDNLS